MKNHLQRVYKQSRIHTLLWLLVGVASIHVAQAQSPGGVSSGLDFWFDPATNVTRTGPIVTAWGDKASGGNNPSVVQATVSLQPAYADGDVGSNYNPYINFTANDRLNQLITGSAFSKSHTTFGVVNNYVAKGSYTHFIRFTNENNSDAGLHNWGLGHADSQTDKVAMHYITAPFSGGSGSAGTNPYNKFNSGPSITIGQSMLYGGLIDSSTPASTSVIITHNGNESNWTGATTLASLTPYNYITVGGGNSFGMNNNKTQEIIHFSRALTQTERQRVNTYLGIKHGLTLEHNYLSGTGATIYTVSGYANNITGIGREDVQGLNQKQSRSVNATGLVTIGNGTSIAATNTLNVNSFSADASFEIIGDNGLAASYATAYLPNVYVSPVPSAFRLMSRIWKVQETGTVGTITVSVPATTKAEVLLVSSSATFTPGVASEITLTPDGNGNMTAQVNLTDGQFFTFGSTVRAPGGVSSNLNLWLRADLGTNTSTNGGVMTSWDDQSPNNRTHTQATAVFQPKYKTNGFNFNPAVTFDGLDVMTADAFASGQEAVHVFAMAKVADGGWRSIYGFGRDVTHVQWLYTLPSVWTSGNYYAAAQGGIDYGVTSYILPKDGTQRTIHWNGTSSNIAGTNAYPYNAGKMGVGSDVSTDGGGLSENFFGDIAEVVVYKTGTPIINGGRMATPDIEKVESYLGLKYGVTLSHNYVAADGAIVYNVSSYSTNITGIGRDDAQVLNQKQSKSVNAKSILTIGLGTALAASNAANANSFPANNSFEIVGDNGLPYSYSAVYAPTSFTPAGGAGFYRMAATWKVQETGTVGTVVIGAASSTGADYLLVSNSASFPSGSTQELILTADGNGNLVATVDLTNGQFFTFGSAGKAPGGILSGLNLWLKAESLSGTTEGGTVSAWNNSMLNNQAYGMTQPTATYQPLYYGTTASKLVNYNPTLYYDGSAMMLGNENPLMPATSAYTFLSVGIDEDTNDGLIRALFSSENLVDQLAFYKYNATTTSSGWRPYTGGFKDFGLGNKYSPVGGTNSYWNGTNFTVNTSRTQNIQPQIVGMASASATVGTFLAYTSWNDGYKEVPASTLYRYAGSLQSYGVGADMTSLASFAEFWLGRTPEQIAYNRQLTDAEMAKVNTYLAIKYGVTLGQGGSSSTATVGSNVNSYSYVATDGTVIWNPTTNAGYAYDIAGIGLDNFEGLNQKQSKSVNAGFQPALGLGTVEASNEANGNSFAADKSYMVWGSNGLGTQYSVAYTPSFVTTAPYSTMPRIWRVQETGTVGLVTVSAPGSIANTLLLVSNGTNFATSSGVTEYTMVSDGNGNLTAQVNLASGQYFTFALPVYSPGCVAGGPAVWLKADLGVVLSGSLVAAWNDLSATGAVLSQATAGSQPLFNPSTLANYNAGVTFGTGGGKFLSTSTKVIDRANGTMYVAGNTTNPAQSQYWAGFSDFGDFPGLYHATDNRVFLYPQQFIYSNVYPFAGGEPILYGASWANGLGTNATLMRSDVRLNGGSATSSAFLNVNTSSIYDNFRIGSDNNWAALTGAMNEVIVFENELTQPEKERVETYLGIKYGITVRHNYLAGNSAIIYNVSSFSSNILGIGRDDCQQLVQKQSQSVNTPRLTIALSTTIATDNASNPGSFSSDASFLITGDNGLTGLSSFSSVTAACPAPPASDKYTNLAYKATETGSVAPVFVQFDASGYGFNPVYPLYMQVATDAAFTNMLASVPMSFSGSIASTTYDFPANSTVYYRFAGNTTSLANICAAPKPLTFHWNGWWYGTKNKTLIGNYNLNNTLVNPVMSVSITDGTSDPNVLLYKPTVNWWPVFDGLGIFIPRYDNTANETSITTTRMKFFSQSSLGVASTSAVAAQTVDFILRDIDGYIGGKDIVKVYGKLGAATVFPKITKTNLYPGLASTALTISGNTITAGNLPWDLTVLGNAYVSFDSPVEEVFVEYTKDNTYAFRVYNDLRIGAVNITCKIPTPRAPLADNVYVYKQATPSVQKTNEPVVYKFTIQNTDCANKVINFNDVLPGGLNWVDSTLVTSMAYGSVNAYGNDQTVTINSLTVTPGTSYIWLTATGAFPNTYLNQATYTVNGGTGATLLSDDPGEAGTAMQPTPLTLVQNDPEANLTVNKTVDKATAPQNGTVTYTYTITNPNASSAVLTTFHDVLPGELTYIGSSLSGLSGGYTSGTGVTPYSGSAVLSMRDLSIAANSSLTFTVQANTNSYTLGAVANNVAQVSPDVDSGFRIQQFNSNAASTTISAPPTVTISTPLNTTTALNPTVSGTATPGSTVVLTSSTSGTICTTTATAGGTWSCPVNLIVGPQTLSAVASNGAGTSSPAITQITALVAAIQANNPPALTATQGTSNTGSAAADLTPSGGTTPYSYSNATGEPSCSAVAGATALPNSSLTVNSSTGAYSYTAPATPGVYYFCIKVCDATLACVTKTYTLTVSAPGGVGVLDCSTAQISGIVAGTPGNGVLKLSINVTTAGQMPVTVSGSGLVTSPNPYIINPTATGVQTFYVPLSYSGAAFAAGTTITVTGAGVCTVDMTAVTPKTITTSVLNLGPACSPATAATLVK